MLHAKRLMKARTNWENGSRGRNYQATIAVAGWASNPYEPLLLEALANHPGCTKLYYVPLDGKGDSNRAWLRDQVPPTYNRWRDWLRTPGEAFETQAYDLTALLDRRGGPSLGAEQLETRLLEHFRRHKLRPLSSDQINLYMAGHGEHRNDGPFFRSRHMSMLNIPETTLPTDRKTFLPAFGKHMEKQYGIRPVPRSQAVDNCAELTAFMDHHGFNQVVLKVADNCAGNGIYRIFREATGMPLMADYPDKDFKPTKKNPRIFPLTDDHFPRDGMLAMEWLDNSKGDIRVVILCGKTVGAYKRMPKENAWLCNFHQGGTIEPVDMLHDMSESDRRKADAIAKMLEKYGMNSASIDLLANTQGERFLSEINIGNTDDIIELEKHWGATLAAHDRMGPADQMASMIMSDYRIMVDKTAEAGLVR